MRLGGRGLPVAAAAEASGAVRKNATAVRTSRGSFMRKRAEKAARSRPPRKRFRAARAQIRRKIFRRYIHQQTSQNAIPTKVACTKGALAAPRNLNTSSPRWVWKVRPVQP